LHVLYAAAQQKKKPRVVYASSSSVYGENPDLPKRESQPTAPISPYAATKVAGEIYASVWNRLFGVETVGLRYFNVFGPRQDPHGAYAAVIPRWIANLIRGEPVQINGDGETSRDFCFIENVVQANLLAAMTAAPSAVNQVYNVALGERTTLNELLAILRRHLPGNAVGGDSPVVHGEFRRGDVRHSLADIGKARELLGYEPTHRLEAGLEQSMSWYRRRLG
jgi:UDP-N-acetylglucosamine 4-epimerase